MKTNIKRILAVLVLILLLLTAAYIVLKALKPGALNKPESIAFDQKNNRFLISNSGNGKIITLDSKGKYRVLISKGLDNPRGIRLKDSKLYVADNKAIKIIDLTKKIVLTNIPVKGAKMLNDLTFDRDGLLYATDTQANKIFVIDPGKKTVRDALASPLMKAPNGIFYDRPRDQMLIVCFKTRSEKLSTNPILAYNTKSREFSEFMPSKPNSHLELDGVTEDPDTGILYFSSWADRAVYMIPQEQNRIETVQTDIESPADILFHKGEILIPVFNKNKIERIRVD